MSITSIKSLPIDESLKSRLTELLEQFESYRIYNDLDAVQRKEEPVNTPPKKKRKISFLEKLFITEYDDE